MKKLLVLLVLLFVTSIYSQTPIDLGRNGTIWNDSLYCGETVVGDSVYFVDLNFDYEDALIFLQGNANDTVDSVNVKWGTYVFNNSTKAIVDTVYGAATIIVNTATGKQLSVTQPMQLLQLSFANDYATLPDRSCSFIIQAKRK